MTGLYLLQINPASLTPLGVRRQAASSSTFVNPWTLACRLACRLVYRGAESRIVSWAYGEGAATTIASARRKAIGTLTAAYTGSDVVPPG